MTRLKTPVGIWHTPPDHDMCVNTLSQKSVIFVFLCTHQNAKCWNLGNAFLAQSALFWEPVLSTFDPLLSHYVVYTYRKPWSTSIYMPTPIVPKTYSGFDQNLRRVLAKNRPKSGSKVLKTCSQKRALWAKNAFPSFNILHFGVYTKTRKWHFFETGCLHTYHDLEVYAIFPPVFLDMSWKRVLKKYQNWGKKSVLFCAKSVLFCAQFWPNFGSILGPFLGPIWVLFLTHSVSIYQ